MRRYRYRTSALAGPWRSSPKAALRDAIAARQVRHDEGAEDGLVWVVPGKIEQQSAENDSAGPAPRAVPGSDKRRAG